MSPHSTSDAARSTESECEGEARVIAFVDGRLNRSEGLAFENHLDECDACRELVAVIAAEHDAKQDGADAASQAPASEESRDALLRVLDPDSLAPGTVLAGRFRILEPLGTGATATTYRVVDEQLGEESALKVLKDEGGASSRLVAKELVIARKLNHPNVCRVHDVGSEDGVHFFGMELIHGETLEKALRRGIDPSAVMGILKQICMGMEAAHQQGIVHRDLKPANIMIESATNRVVLMDFGLAADLDSEESRAKIVGTPAYWAPEQARGEEPSTASDIYSFGLIAYKMFAGRSFKLSDPDALAHVPRPCRPVVARCLDASPRARYQDASELRLALSAPPRSWKLLGLLAVALILGIACFAWFKNPTARAPASADEQAITTPLATAPSSRPSVANDVAPALSTSPSSTAIPHPNELASSSVATSNASAVAVTKPRSAPRVQSAVRNSDPTKPAISSAKSIETTAPSATAPSSDLLYKR